LSFSDLYQKYYKYTKQIDMALARMYVINVREY